MALYIVEWFTRTCAGRTENPDSPKPLPEIATDDQTGKAFELAHETPFAVVIAGISATYLIASLGILLWLLFDTWSGRNLLLVRWGYDKTSLASGSFRLAAFVALGGALGGTVDGLRSIIAWHSERRAYGPRFIWKDLALPLIGAAVGLFAYATVRSGVGVFNGDFSLDQKGGSPAVAAFAVSTLAGFSSLQVFRWLDAQANKIFSVTNVSQTIVPDLKGMTLDQATAAIKTRKLILGDLNKPTDQSLKVQGQSPGPGSAVPEQTSVDITFETTTENPDPATRF